MRRDRMRAQVPPIERSESLKLAVRGLETQTRELLIKHRLDIPPRTFEMLTNTIAKKIGSPLGKVRGPSARQRMKRGLIHARKLLEYYDRKVVGNRLAQSIATRSAAMAEALDDLGVVIRLAIIPSVDIVDLLARCERGAQTKNDVTVLTHALELALQPTGMPGRPRDETSRVIRSACIVWKRAGRQHERKFTWNEAAGTASGPLIQFARDLFELCELKTPDDNALYCAMRAAMQSIR